MDPKGSWGLHVPWSPSDMWGGSILTVAEVTLSSDP